MDQAMAISSQSITVSLKLDRLREEYEIYDHLHAIAILTLDYPVLLGEICQVLGRFKITIDQIKKPGGSESEIPKAFSMLLRPFGWEPGKMFAKMMVNGEEASHDTHIIDFIKGEVALDLEWNSKDQTFDRDLYSFRAFFDYRKIGVGILITRANSLNDLFKSLGTYIDPGTKKPKTYMAKYGASTTHIAKLLPRLRAGRSGGCPVLVFGITPKQITK
ncbi:MAG TPA: BglII/BstYI family type II restriction endonuclease [Candidatus Methylacidiphilales bacterium]|nr:BglII/BstYI family type II restriction endonuclease [Candidatus Methylacidiphilales bacterium]